MSMREGSSRRPPEDEDEVPLYPSPNEGVLPT
jgi:hypothetical protein